MRYDTIVNLPAMNKYSIHSILKSVQSKEVNTHKYIRTSYAQVNKILLSKTNRNK